MAERKSGVPGGLVRGSCYCFPTRGNNNNTRTRPLGTVRDSFHQARTPRVLMLMEGLEFVNSARLDIRTLGMNASLGVWFVIFPIAPS